MAPRRRRNRPLLVGKPAERAARGGCGARGPPTLRVVGGQAPACAPCGFARTQIRSKAAANPQSKPAPYCEGLMKGDLRRLLADAKRRGWSVDRTGRTGHEWVAASSAGTGRM